MSEATPACSRCGRDGEHDFGDMWLCTDCYYEAGSSCSGGPQVAATSAAPANDLQDDSGLVC